MPLNVNGVRNHLKLGVREREVLRGGWAVIGKRRPWGSLAGTKFQCLRSTCPVDIEEARRRVAAYVRHDNEVRLHSAIGYVTPADKLAGLEEVIFAERDRKLEEARLRRAAARQAEREVA